MSLVNEMLNELQKEKSKGGNFDGLVAVNNDNNRSLWFKASIVLTLVLITAITLWGLFFDQHINNNLLSNSKTVDTSKDKIDTDSNLNTADMAKSNVDILRVKSLAEKVIKKSNQQNSPPINSNDKMHSTELSNNLDSNSVANHGGEITTDSKLANLNKLKNKTASTSNKDIEKMASTETRNKSLSKLIEKPSKKSMIKVSRKSLAEKELRLITNEWSSKSSAENRTLVEQFLQDFSNLDTAWLGAVDLVEDKDLAYHQKLLVQALNDFPEQPAFRMIVVKQQIAQNNYANALLEIQKIDTKHWQQSQFRIAGFLAQKVNDHVSAIRFYNQLLKNQPNQGDINMAIAISLEALNENNLAVAKFQRALEDSSLKPIQRQFIAQRIAVLKG